ncbi:MAG: hypothetical protein PHI23_05100 [Candidatus Peribacteraceae bacterium]|nr:hypothetical protein [Candidatus Peribacteraceae bacterium]
MSTITTPTEIGQEAAVPPANLQSVSPPQPDSLPQALLDECRVTNMDIADARELVHQLVVGQVGANLGKMQSVRDAFMQTHKLRPDNLGGLLHALINAERLQIDEIGQLSPVVRRKLNMCLCEERCA